MSYFFIVTDPLHGDRTSEVVYTATTLYDDLVEDEVSAVGAYDAECSANDVDLCADQAYEVHEVEDHVGIALTNIVQDGEHALAQHVLLTKISPVGDRVTVAQGRAARAALLGE